MSIRNALLCCIAAVGFTTGATAAETKTGPVGLVMSVDGKVTPEIGPYTEIVANTKLELASGAKVTFVHYPSCRLVTVAGGSLNFDQQDVTLEGGSVEKESQQKCPKELKMKIAGVAGGVRFRAIPTAFLADKPRCTLVGPRNKGFASARVMDGEQPVATLALNGPQLLWPAGQAALQVDKRYRLELTPKTPGEQVFSMDFAVSAEAPTSETECLLRVE